MEWSEVRVIHSIGKGWKKWELFLGGGKVVSV